MHRPNGKSFTEAEAAVLHDIMRNRRDVRGNRFLDTLVDETVLQQLLHVALYAPSVGFFRNPWEFLVIR